jgi:methylglutamate dehydrogenase subunit B
MLLIDCPWCGTRPQTEFSYGADASIERPAADAPPDEWVNYVYLRTNPRGPHVEYWHHVHGCRLWLRVVRDTLSHEIRHVTAAITKSGART